MSEWIFGIDGGGTSSRIRAESMSGELLYQGSAGSTNLDSNDTETVCAAIRDLIGGALAKGLEPTTCQAGYIGSAGIDMEEDKATMLSVLSDAFNEVSGCQRVNPVFGAGNDSEPALVGALADIEGLLLIAGTGSIALGRTRTGRSERAGGWGHFLGDEGSAFWIAFEGIKRGIRSCEGRDSPSELLEAAIRHFGLPHARSLIPFTYWNFEKARIATFAPKVAELAAGGDALARTIVNQAVEELTALVLSVYERLLPEIRGTRLALYGGLLDKNLTIRTAISERISVILPSLQLVEPAGDAQTGACRLARELMV